MILVDILEEHLEEADFLWQQREAALDSRDYDLAELAELEERFLAHLDGLGVGGKEAWKLLLPKLEEGEEGETLAAALVGLESGRRERIDAVLDAFSGAGDDLPAGLVAAWRHTTYPGANPFLESQLESASAAVRAAATEALGFRRAPVAPARLTALLGDDDPRVVAAAVRTAGRLRLDQLMGPVGEVHESTADPSVRGEAWETGLLLGSGRCLSGCRRAVSERGDQAARAITLLGLGGRPEDRSLLESALGQPALARAAVLALGLLGDPAAVEPLIRCAAETDLARLAGEALSRITGVHLSEAGLEAEAAEAETVVPPDDTGDEEEYVEDPDEGLPRPDPQKLEAWWGENGSRFDEKVRWRLGRPHDAELLIEILRQGSMADRRFAAFELALADASGSYPECSAFCARQHRELEEIASPAPEE
jgi:uncharacterized protein (TIGR02270 family)